MKSDRDLPARKEHEMQFYKCLKCGNFVVFLTPKTACTPRCCGEEMAEVKPNTQDAALEKHVPAVTVEGNKVSVQVGSVAHPMLPEHYIQFVILETNKGFQKKDLAPGEEPKAEFLLSDGKKPVAVYEYCNLHGLWSYTI